jgi:hypothetical protein
MVVSGFAFLPGETTLPFDLANDNSFSIKTMVETKVGPGVVTMP